MYYIYILLTSLIISDINSQSIEEIITDYFRSEIIQDMRNQWDIHRKPLENAVSLALKETVGFGGMNVYIRKFKEKLATGYFHNDNQVQLILKDLNLADIPKCTLPEVQFSLPSNVLKIQTSLSKIIIHAEYALVRNQSDIIYETKDQDPFKASPFLFEQVHDSGKVAIAMDRCTLSGYIFTTLTGESVNLGYPHIKLLNCEYTIEIYRPGAGYPPVIAKYVPYRDGPGLGLTHLLLKAIDDELIPKLQAAMFSFVNTTSVFGIYLPDFQNSQQEVFRATSMYLAKVIRNLNRITAAKNEGVVELTELTLHWENGQVASSKENVTGQTLTLSEMVLSGLDSMYSAHIGGPYKMNVPMIGEEIRFSSLQVRGILNLNSKWADKYAFAAELLDLAVDLELDILTDRYSVGEGPVQTKLVMAVRKIEVSNIRAMSFTVPIIIFAAAESLIAGYLMKEVPRAIYEHLMDVFPEALRLQGEMNFNDEELKTQYDFDEIPVEEIDNGENNYVASVETYGSDMDIKVRSRLKKKPGKPGKRIRSQLKKNKRVKRPNQRSRSQQKRKHSSNKRTADNRILKE